MLAFEPAPAGPATAAAADPTLNHHFVVSAMAEPGVLPRALDLLAKRGLVPTECHSFMRQPSDPQRPPRLSLELRVEGLEPMAADHVAACLRQIFGVESVLHWGAA